MISVPARRLFFVLFASLLVACGSQVRPDGDAAGYLPPEDCDDTDGSVYPGRGERCDDIDNDCDGVVDEGYDEDGDGFKVCGDQPDCDDYNEQSYPGADEICDGEDNNCDGTIDEGDFLDADGDGRPDFIDCREEATSRAWSQGGQLSWRVSLGEH